MELVRLKGVRQDSKGTIYQVTKVESDGDTISDEIAEDYYEFTELAADPAAPAANKVRFYAKDNAGKTTLYARFATGAVQAIAAQP